MNSPTDAIGSMWSQKILNVATIGTAKIIPEIPHIQPQKASATRITTGFKVSDLPRTKGVMKFPSRIARSR